MPLTTSDTVAIHQLLALHGHLIDSGELHRLDELFTADATYDVTALGQSATHGIAAFRAAVEAFVGDERNPVGHHVTNIVVAGDDGRAVARSKGIGVLHDGTTSTVTYLDDIAQTRHGWRIIRRQILPSTSP